MKKQTLRNSHRMPDRKTRLGGLPFAVLSYALLVALSATPISARADYKPQLGPNLVQDGGFETGGTQWSLGSARIVSSVHRNGNSSLEYENLDPQANRFIQQGIPVSPGEIVRFGAYIKGEGLTAKGAWKAKGSGIFIQSYDADNKYISGSFPFNLPGTFDWTPLQGLYVVPANAKRVTVGLYLRAGTVGKAWFDDISVQVEKPRAFGVVLQYPNYRGITTSQNRSDWKISVKREAAQEAQQASLIQRITNSTGKILSSETVALNTADKEHVISWHPPPDIAPGDYDWEVAVNPGGETKPELHTFKIQVLDKMPPVYIDAEGFTRIAGQRFFPFGVYTGKTEGRESVTTSPEHLQRMTDAGLNTVLSYYYGDRGDAAQFLENANQKGLKVIFSLVTLYDGGADFPPEDLSASARAKSVVSKYRQSPGLLGWYIGDEYGYGEVSATQTRYEEIKAADDHPILQVQNKLDVLPWNFDGVDVLGTDPYPARLPESLLTPITRYVGKSVEVAAGAKGVWQVSQIHDHSLHKGKGGPPSLDQMRNMAYQNLIGGAKGLLFYSYHWLYFTRGVNNERVVSDAAYEKRWPEVRQMTLEVKSVLPVILKDKKIALTPTGVSSVPFQAWEDGDQLFLMIANPEPKEAEISLKIPWGWRLTGQPVPGVKATFAEGNLQLKCAAIASGVVVLKR